MKYTLDTVNKIPYISKEIKHGDIIFKFYVDYKPIFITITQKEMFNKLKMKKRIEEKINNE